MYLCILLRNPFSLLLLLLLYHHHHNEEHNYLFVIHRKRETNQPNHLTTNSGTA